GKRTLCLHVGINLIVQTALQLAALSGQLLRVDGEILDTCCRGGYGDEVRHPSTAAQLMSTGADTANAASFLTGSNLFHLNLDTKLGCQHFDQLPEVDTLIGNIIEYGFVAVTLILHIADLHLQS